jgi:hypothetical protein
VRWYLDIGGVTSGPFNPAAIIQMARDGRLPAGTVLRDGPGGTVIALEDAPFYRRSIAPVLTQIVARDLQRNSD